MKTMTHENNFITASWNVRESNSEKVDSKIEMGLKPEFHKMLREYKYTTDSTLSDKEFWSWNTYGSSNRVESEIIEIIERDFNDFSKGTSWFKLLTSKHLVNGYSICFNDSWKEFQTYHPEIGSTEGFQSYAEAVEYCKKG